MSEVAPPPALSWIRTCLVFIIFIGGKGICDPEHKEKEKMAAEGAA